MEDFRQNRKNITISFLWHARISSLLPTVPTAWSDCPWMMIFNERCTVIKPEGPQTPSVAANAARATECLFRQSKASHLDAVWLLVEQTLGCCRGGKERDSISAQALTESWAWGYANMQRAYQSSALIFKLQVPKKKKKSNCRNLRSNATDALDGIITCGGKLLYYILIHLWSAEG